MLEQWNRPNGVLSLVPAELVGGAMQRLPQAGPDSLVAQTVDIDVPGRGRARVTFETYRYRHGRSFFWAWRATRADPLGDFVVPVPPAGGCFTCTHLLPLASGSRKAVCGRKATPHAQDQPELGCRHYEREPGADDDIERLLQVYGFPPKNKTA